MNDLETTLDVIARKAQALRDAGVTGEIRVGDIHFEITPAPSTPAASNDQEPIANPEKDPDTYGGELPRRRGESSPVEDDGHERRNR